MKPKPKTAPKSWSASLPATAILLGCFLTGSATSSITGADTPAVGFELAGESYVSRSEIFSRDLQWLAAWRLPDQVEVWNVAKGEKTAQWTAGPIPRGRVVRHGQQLAFLGDGRKLLVATATNLAVRDLVSGQIEQTLDESGADLDEITVSPDGNYVAGVIWKPSDYEFALWSLPDGRRLTRLPTKRAPWERPRYGFPAGSLRRQPISMLPGTSWAFSPDGNSFAIGYEFAVDLWDLKMGKWLSRFTGMEVPEFRIGAVTFGGGTTVAFLSSTNVAIVCGGALAVLNAETNLSALVVKNPAGPPNERLEIRALGVSADGKRLAVAGMRMASRRSYGDPGAGAVFDQPRRGEIQVWEAFPLRWIATIQCKINEKFSAVALDVAGNRVAAVTTGVRYTATMNYVAQQGAERSPTGPYRVATWDVK